MKERKVKHIIKADEFAYNPKTQINTKSILDKEKKISTDEKEQEAIASSSDECKNQACKAAQQPKPEAGEPVVPVQTSKTKAKPKQFSPETKKLKENGFRVKPDGSKEPYTKKKPEAKKNLVDHCKIFMNKKGDLGSKRTQLGIPAELKPIIDLKLTDLQKICKIILKDPKLIIKRLEF